MMQAKRVEIITPAREADAICRHLPDVGIIRYTLLRNVAGHGKRHAADADDMSDIFSNSLIIVICSDEEAEKLVDMVVPRLERHSGICTVQDCQVVRPGVSSAGEFHGKG